MNTFIALLRGINVGGHKKILMADLKLLFESLEFEQVTTYIQSGNVVFKAKEETNLANRIAEAIESKYGFIVPVLVKKGSELSEIMSKCPFSNVKREKSYFILLKENPSEESVELTSEFSSSDEEFYIEEKCVYIYYAVGAGKARMGNNFFEKKLKVNATARNFRTMAKLIAMVSS
tara:strand:- start:191 stop:718 length:528 start_codon:yes stop_codon:yes gene_type:complete